MHPVSLRSRLVRTLALQQTRIQYPIYPDGIRNAANLVSYRRWLKIFWYLLLVLVTMVFSLLFTRGMRRAFSRFRSREEKAGKELIYRHFPRKKKPLGGGVAIFGSLIVGLGVARLLPLIGTCRDTPWWHGGLLAALRRWPSAASASSMIGAKSMPRAG